MTTDCPTPTKQAHRNRGAARAAAKSLRRANRGLVSPDLDVYRCVCGSWHVGHSAAALTRRIRRAIRKERS